MTLRNYLTSPLVAHLESALARERTERAEERRYWASVVAKAEHRATAAEGYARALTDRVLEKRAGIVPVTVLPREREPVPKRYEEVLTSPNFVPLADVEQAILEMERDAQVKYGDNGMELGPKVAPR